MSSYANIGGLIHDEISSSESLVMVECVDKITSDELDFFRRTLMKNYKLRFLFRILEFFYKL